MIRSLENDLVPFEKRVVSLRKFGRGSWAVLEKRDELRVCLKMHREFYHSIRT